MAAKNTTPAAKSKKSKGAAPAELPVAVQTEIVNDAPTFDLRSSGETNPPVGELLGDLEPSIAALLSEIGEMGAGSPEAATHVQPSDEEIELAAAAASATDISLQSAVDGVPAVHKDPEPEGEQLAAAKGKKGGKKKGDAPASEKPAASKRIFYGKDKVRRLNDKLGDSAGEFTVLTLGDAGLDEDALKQKVAETFELIKSMNTKKANRATNLIEFVAGKRGSLNPVLKRVLTMLSSKGIITMGVQGNVLTDLVNNPAPGERAYTIAAARAMAGNTVSMFEDLKLIVPQGKHAFVSNPDSLLLMKVNQLLGLQMGSAPTA